MTTQNCSCAVQGSIHTNYFQFYIFFNVLFVVIAPFGGGGTVKL